MNEVVCLDTETTGLSARDGDRIIELGGVILRGPNVVDRYQQYVNPQRSIPEEAARIHGIRDHNVADMPIFAEVAQEFLAFIGTRPLVIHNAPFDMGFLNAELTAIGLPPLANEVIDTLAIARNRFGASARNSLDALCDKFGVNRRDRTFHGALLDSELLTEVYLNLIGGLERGQVILDVVQQETDVLSPETPEVEKTGNRHQGWPERMVRTPSASELAAHQAMLEKITKPVWRGKNEAISSQTVPATRPAGEPSETREKTEPESPRGVVAPAPAGPLF